MRAALWFLALFGAAVAVALFAGNNQGTITVFWPPWRVDLSLNMVVLLLLGGFTLLYAALRGLSKLLQMPVRARLWRLQQKERAMHGALLDALSQMLAGRFLRARKAAESAIAQAGALDDAKHRLPHGTQLRTLAHLVAAESSHALQDKSTREAHLQQALDRWTNAMPAWRWSAWPPCPREWPGAPWRCVPGSRPRACRTRPSRPWRPHACWASTTRSRRWPLKA